MQNLYVKSIAVFFPIFLLFAGTSFAKQHWTLSHLLHMVEPEISLKQPTSLYVDAEINRYYVVDSGNNRLVSFNKDGKFIHSFDAMKSLAAPFSMSKNDNGHLTVVEKGKNCITSINLKTKEIKQHEIETNGIRIYPQQIEHKGDNLFILDKRSGVIFKIDKRYQVTQEFRCENCLENNQIDFKLVDNGLISLDGKSHTIYQFDWFGKVTKEIKLNRKMQFPVSLAMAENGLFYVLDRHAGSIFVFDAHGLFKEIILAYGHKPGHLYYPTQIQFDPWGRLCVVEEGNGRVAIFEK